ncbi:TonB-dependent receptor [Alteromonas gilva]|uniref:TonB-dependent receptor n=1 Tax=Alteromonas gilva TaxID=2987522 RepID=A0ABT5L4T1_9ALTE|nr:TonB-dependent receptor [Alteromonas gilva]MDC8831868.1 TonB-dependent receptor [Alteromonas gilva]
MKHLKRLPLTVLASAIACSFAGAQENAQSDTEQTKKSEGFEVILVEAQRTTQNLQEVPVSVQVLYGSDLDDQNINELTQLSALAPTLQVGQDNTFAIRGIGSQIFAETIDPSVALAIDGVSLGRNALAGQPFNDIASIEVLNGPQGLLFGKNASAGLINITTQRPILDEFSGHASLEYNLRDTTPTDATGQIVKGTLNMPVSDHSALRVNVLYSDQDPLIDNVYPNDDVRTDLGQEKRGIKAKYLYLDGPLTVYLMADYNTNDGTGERYSRTFRTVDPNSELVDLLAADNIVAGPENMVNNSDGAMFRDVETGGLQGEVSYLFESGIELINIAAWRYFDSDTNLHNDFSSKRDIVDNPNTNEYSQVSNELRFIFPETDSYRGQAGLFYFNSTSDMTNRLEVQGPPPFVAVGFPYCVGAEISGPPPGCPYSNDVFLGNDSITELEQTSYAAFGQFDFFLTDKLTATAGARVTQDEISTDVLQMQRDYFIGIGGPRGRFVESVDNTNISWKLGMQYQSSSELMLYASVGQGYKAPGFNTDNQGNENIPFAVEDEISTTVEAGFKSTLLDNKLIFNVSLFNTKFDNYQAQSFNLEAQAFIIQNAATVTSRGAEISARALVSDNLTLFWDASVLDSTFDEFDAASCTPDSVECGPDDAFFNAAGYSTPLAADFTSNLQAKYERELTADIYGFVNAGLYYRSEISYGIGSPETELDAISTFNISAGIETMNGLQVSVFCNNCTDEKYPFSIAFDPGENNDGLISTQQSWGLNSVRSIGISVSQSF